MLNEKEIDNLMKKINNNEEAYLYYVTHMIEGRMEDILEQNKYKDIAQFKIVKVKVSAVYNAYFEYMNYVQNPNNYHIEEEEYYYPSDNLKYINYIDDPTKYNNIDRDTDKYHPSEDIKYIKYFITPNLDNSYTKDINARIPSVIYGYKRKIYNKDGVIKELIDPTPIRPVFKNRLTYGDDFSTNKDFITKNKLEWKYKFLKNGEMVDGIKYNFVSSNWYILTLKNYPTIEKPLINVNTLSPFFSEDNIVGAFSYIEQLVA